MHTAPTVRLEAPRSIQETLLAAAQFSPDPFPDDVPTAQEVEWWYLPGEYEAGTLHRIVTESDAVARYSEYATNYRHPTGSLAVTTVLAAGEDAFVIRSNGTAMIWADGRLINDGIGDITVSMREGGRLEMRIVAAPGEPATFAIMRGQTRQTAPFAALDSDQGLRVRRGGTRPPHLEAEPTVEVALTENAGLLEAPAEILATLAVSSSSPPTIATGESRAEARTARGADQEDAHDMRELRSGAWESCHALAFRFVDTAIPAQDIVARAHIRPLTQRGAFVCSDPVLSRIWGVSAYTLRLCMQGLMVDGLKRDRMPWIGDQAISVLANAFAFGDAQIAYDSHYALGAPTSGYVNGISDYSLWWVITAEMLAFYFPDHDASLGARVESFVRDLMGQSGDDGLFMPGSTRDGFTASSAGSVLIDWGYHVPDGSISTALQMLWVWALDCAQRLVSSEWAAKFAAVREVALRTLRERGWSQEHRAWRAFVDGQSVPDTYANFLAVSAGISNASVDTGVVAAFAGRRGRTPYMQTVLLRAIAEGRNPRAVFDGIRTDWGSMLEEGSTTFWEEFPEPGESPYAMYGRTFARSLCHAWGAGPAALLPETVFGIRMLSPGWERFSLCPPDLDLDWAAAVIPSASGMIGIRSGAGFVEVDLPAGVTAVLGDHSATGPTTHRFTANHPSP
jgi:alpha-L-rhamnosidase